MIYQWCELGDGPAPADVPEDAAYMCFKGVDPQPIAAAERMVSTMYSEADSPARIALWDGCDRFLGVYAVTITTRINYSAVEETDNCLRVSKETGE